MDDKLACTYAAIINIAILTCVGWLGWLVYCGCTVLIFPVPLILLFWTTPRVQHQHRENGSSKDNKEAQVNR